MQFLLYTVLIAFVVATGYGCETDDDCSLNGICTSNHICFCDLAWRAGDCGELDLYPATRWSGYNHTNATGPDFYKEGAGNSSWGGHVRIIRDPVDAKLFHLITSQMAHGCGLGGWKPFGTIIRAESRSGPRGPYVFAQKIFNTFHHNPATIYVPADGRYLLYCIGRDIETPGTCSSQKFNNTIWVASSPDLREWDALEPLLVNQTNPAPWPLWSPVMKTYDMLLAVEDSNIYFARNSSGPYTIEVQPHNTYESEDPFLWQDKRGHWHFLLHYMVDIPLGLKGPRVGAHAYARDWKGPWTFNNKTLAYNTTVKFDDGTEVEYYRRERPKLYFSDDGEMTPLYLLNGVQEFNKSGSYTLVQPIGRGARAYEEKLGFL